LGFQRQRKAAQLVTAVEGSHMEAVAYLQASKENWQSREMWCGNGRAYEEEAAEAKCGQRKNKTLA